MSIKLPNTQENQTLIENTTFTTLGYDNRWKLHRVRITKDKVTENENNLIDIFKVAYQFSLK